MEGIGNFGDGMMKEQRRWLWEPRHSMAQHSTAQYCLKKTELVPHGERRTKTRSPKRGSRKANVSWSVLSQMYVHGATAFGAMRGSRGENTSSRRIDSGGMANNGDTRC